MLQVPQTHSRSPGRYSHHPTELCRRNCNQDIYPLCNPPLVITTAAAIHPHHIFVDEFAYGISGDCTRGCSGKDPQQTADCRTDAGTDEATYDGTGFASCGCCYKAAGSCPKQCCSSSGFCNNIRFASTNWTIHKFTFLFVGLKTGRFYAPGMTCYIRLHHFRTGCAVGLRFPGHCVTAALANLWQFTIFPDAYRPARSSGLVPYMTDQPATAYTF